MGTLHLKQVEVDGPSNAETAPALSAQVFTVLTSSDSHALIQWIQKTSETGFYTNPKYHKRQDMQWLGILMTVKPGFDSDCHLPGE